jgi:hypothetical protein
MNVWARGEARMTEAGSSGGTGKGEGRRSQGKWEVGCPERAGKGSFSLTVPHPP